VIIIRIIAVHTGLIPVALVSGGDGTVSGRLCRSSLHERPALAPLSRQPRLQLVTLLNRSIVDVPLTITSSPVCLVMPFSVAFLSSHLASHSSLLKFYPAEVKRPVGKVGF